MERIPSLHQVCSWHEVDQLDGSRGVANMWGKGLHARERNAVRQNLAII